MDINGGRLSFDAYIRETDFKRQLDAMERRIIGMSDRVVRETRRMDNAMSVFAASIGGYFSQAAITDFVTQLINVRSEFQQLDITFTTMLKSKQLADQLMAELVEFSGTTPFGLKDAANAAKQLLAYGSAANQVTAELRMLGDVAAGTSQPIGELVYLYGTLRTQGRAQQEDINQFAGRGIPIYKELARVLGINVNQVRDFVSAGKVGFAEVEQAFRNMTAAGSMFGGLMEAQAQTFAGEIERVRDAWDMLLNDIGKANEGLIGDAISGVGSLIENYDKVLDVLSSLVVVYGSYRAALIATAALKQLNAARTVGLTTVELLHLGAITAKTAAMRALNAVMLASPVLALTAAISGLVAITYALTQVTDATTSAQEKLSEAQEAGAKSADSEKRNIDQLIGVLQRHTSTAEQKKAAYDKILAQTNGILDSYSQEEIATGKATQKLEEYIQKIREAASARKAFEEFNELAEKMDDLERNGIEAIGTWERLGRSLRNTFTPTSQGIGFGEWVDLLFNGDSMSKKIVSQQKEVLEESMDELEKTWGDKWEEIITGVKPEEVSEPVVTITKRIKELNTQIAVAESNLKKALDPSAVYDKKKIDDLQTSIKELRAERDLLMGKTKEGDRANKDLENWTEKRLDILQKLADREAEIRAEGMTENERELEEARKHYQELRRIIEEHNRKAPVAAQIGSGVLTMIDNLEKRETGNISYRQETEQLRQNLSEQLDLYRKFQDTRIEIGAQAAKEMYENERGFTEDYRSLITSEINALQGMQMETGLTGVQEARLRTLLDLLKQFDKEERDRATDRTRYLLSTYATYEQKRKILTEKANKEISDLEAKGDRDRAANAKRALDKELLDLYQAEIEANERFHEIMREVDRSGSSLALTGMRQGKAHVMGIITGLKDATQEQKAKLRQIFGDFFDQGIASIEQEDYGNVVSLVNGFGQLVESATQFDGTLTNSLKTIGGMVSQVGQLTQTLSQTLGKAGDSLSKGGGYAAIIGAVLSVASAISDGFNQARQRANEETQKQFEYQNDRQLRVTEAITQALERQLELMNEIYGADRLSKYAESLNGIRQNWIEINDQLDGRYMMTTDQFTNSILARLNNGESAKSILKSFSVASSQYYQIGNILDNLGRFDRLSALPEDINEAREALSKLQYQAALGNVDDYTQKLIDQLSAQIDLYDQTMNRLREETTGTSFESLLSETSNIFFSAGSESGDAWRQGFDNVIEDYLIQKFSRDYLSEKMQAWYETFAEFAEDGLSEQEKELLRAQRDQIWADGNRVLDEMRETLGVDGPADNRNQNSLSGAYARASQESIDLLAGQTGAMRLHLYELTQQGGKQINLMDLQLEMMQRKFEVLKQIESNTAKSAEYSEEYLPYLRSMDNKLGDSLGMQLRAAGKFGY